ncbi:uncharacterized protein PHALS_08909 [Plasmopara halstedii]|uniref:Uncharacterized protein n=1 Tax=Plasmopara halstedii TaxID=4781 RepID=A0A0P1AD96_PLAHL|nr:uncharacterized protein PHALS_08909 [Plasmopara halstedii]CEG38860.1 hypothetical protein PHALS_08909 [Plasmopara halstedii]|eukprot:XP_024575229.1 hypothetical protein PHALS_08909 [Plasmopara halstedii]
MLTLLVENVLRIATFPLLQARYDPTLPQITSGVYARFTLREDPYYRSVI